MIAPITRRRRRSESETISRLCQISRTLGWVETSGVWKATSADWSALAIVFLAEDLKGLANRCWSSQSVGLGTCDGAAAPWVGAVVTWVEAASAGARVNVSAKGTMTATTRATPSTLTRDWFGEVLDAPHTGQLGYWPRIVLMIWISTGARIATPRPRRACFTVCFAPLTPSLSPPAVT